MSLRPFRRLACRAFGHPPAALRAYGRATIFRQRSRMVECGRCGDVMWGPIGMSMGEIARGF